MTTPRPSVLVLGGPGKTGSRLTAKWTGLGLAIRAAARHGADVRSDWQGSTTYRRGLRGIDRVYLVTPVLRDAGFANRIGCFLGLAAANGTSHVTQLSGYGMDQAPPQVAARVADPRRGDRERYEQSRQEVEIDAFLAQPATARVAANGPTNSRVRDLSERDVLRLIRPGMDSGQAGA